MCIEPLLRNIEANNSIEPIVSATLNNKALPKAYAYADDVNATIKNTPQGVEEVFKEYERLTLKSGLELNADKTELMQLGPADGLLEYNATYLGKAHKIVPKTSVKINGIFLQTNREAMVNENIDAVVGKIDKHFKSWSRRNLSTLGKILIVKCFGISQVIYLMQSLSLEKVHFKKLNSILYKFIWNRRYLAAKAPERIKRDIVNKAVKLGGFGMLDIESLDEGLKLRSIGRLLVSKHPYIKLIKAGLDLNDYFNPIDTIGLDKVASKGVALLRTDRAKLWDSASLLYNRNLLDAVGDLGLRCAVNDRGRASIPFFLKWAAGSRFIKDLTIAGLRELRPYIDPAKIKLMENAIRTNSRTPDREFLTSYFVGSKAWPLEKLTSKQIRECRSDQKPITEFKLGLSVSTREGLSWGLKLSKVTNVRHRNMLLRVAHGEFYTKEKLNRFGLIDSPNCPRCDELESLQHKFIECQYITHIWQIVHSSSKNLLTVDPANYDRAAAILGVYLDSNPVILTINAEILQRISCLKDNENYLVHPKHFVKNALKFLIRREQKRATKENLKAVLSTLE